MAFVEETLTSPEWNNKPAVEKAAARKDLFLRSLDDNPSYKQKFNEANASGQKAIYDDWKGAVETKFPDAWTTDGYVMVREEGGGASPYLKERKAKVPVGDFKTEQVLAAINPDTTEGRKTAKEYLGQVKTDKNLRVLLRSRYGNINDLTGDDNIEEENITVEQTPSAGERAVNVAKQLAPTGVRVAGAMTGGVLGGAAAAPTAPATGGVGPMLGFSAGSAGGAAAVEPFAQWLEQRLGQRKEYNVGEGLLNVAMAGVNPVKVAPGAGALMKLGTRATEGAALSGAQNALQQGLFSDKPFSLSELNMSIAGGSIAGTAFEGVGQLSSAIRTRLLGKQPAQLTKSISELLGDSKTPEADKKVLSEIESSINNPQSPQSAVGLRDDLIFESQTGIKREDFPQVIRERAESERISSRDQMMREASGEDLQTAMRANQAAGPEAPLPAENLREQARRQISELDAQRATEVTAELSPQASAMMEKYGRVNPAVMSSIAGGGAGAFYGSTQGETIEEKAKNALAYGIAGLGLGAAGGASLKRLATEDGKSLASKLAKDLPEIIEQAPASMKADLRTMQSNLKRLAPAVFIGIQEGLPDLGIPNKELYNVTDNVANTVTNSTVTRETLEKAGFRVPKTPERYVAGQRYEVPLEQFDSVESLPPQAQITVMEMGGRKAIQVDIPGGPDGRPIFSGSVQDAINAGYDVTLPANLSEGRFTYEQLNSSAYDQQNIPPASSESSAQPNVEAASSSQEVPRSQPEMVQVGSEGKGSRLSSEAGFITPSLIRNAVAPVGGGIAGAAYGASEGDTPQERAANALRYGLLGFGVTSVGARLAIPGTKNIKTFAKELAQGTDALPSWFLRIRDTEPLLRLRETIANNPYARLKKDVSKVAQSGTDISENANPYLAARLFPGRVDAVVKQQAEEAAQTVKRSIDESLDTLAKSSGKSYDEYAQDFQDYTIAKTAKDYNREHSSFGAAASGMSDERADAIVAASKERGIDKVFEDLRKQVREIDDLALTVREQTGLISKAQADNLRKKYPEHVPLNREIDEADDAGVGVYSVPRFNSPRSGIIAGKGSDKEVADVLTSTLVNLKDAIIRGERNQVGQTVREFYKQNPNPAVVVNRAQTGQVPKNAIAVRYNEGGENRTDWVEFKDQLLADSLRNMNQEVTNPLLRGVGRATNLMTQLFTRFSPSFFLASNPIRDRQEVFTNLATSGDIREAARSTWFSNPFRYMKGVSDATLGKESPMADLYRQAEVNGAFTGGLANANRESASKNLAKVSLDRSFLRKGGDAFAGAFNYINDVMNDSSFLRVYDRAKKAGLSDKEAAMLTRNASIDFNLKTPLVKSLGALYGFISPGIHGATTAAKNVIRSPRTIAEVGAGLAGVAIAVDAWNSQQDPDWKKKRMVDFYRRNSVPIALGGDESGTYYLTIPVAQSIRPVKGAMDMVSDLASGDNTDPATAAKRMAEIMADSMSPLGAGDAIQTITPTVADPMMDIERNVSYNQGRISPGYSSTGLDIERVNDRTLTTATGQGALEAAKVLKSMGFDVSPESILYAVRGYGGGPATTAMRAIDTAARNPDQRQSRGPADWPVISSFIKYVPNDTPTVPTKADETLDDSLEIQAYRELERKQVRAENMNTLRNMQLDPNTKGEIVMKRIAGSSNPQRAMEDVVAGMERSANKGTNARGTEIMKLQVETGDRARYIIETLKAQTPEEQVTFIQSLPADALSATVQQQIMAIMQADAAQPGRN